jgi:hypothetical protein
MTVGEWDQRQLCPDGGCVGVIGPDGTCKVCGRAAQNWGDERKRGLIEPADEPADDVPAPVTAAGDDEDDDEDLEDEDLDDDHDLDEGEDEDDGEDDLDDEHEAAPLEASASASIPAAPAEWGTRRLCPDGSCIGLIGLDGRCKVCRRAAAGGPAPAVTAEGGSVGSNGEPAAAPAGFTIVTTDAAVTTTDDAVQTAEATVKTGEPAPSDPAAPTPEIIDPDAKEPGQ